MGASRSRRGPPNLKGSNGIARTSYRSEELVRGNEDASKAADAAAVLRFVSYFDDVGHVLFPARVDLNDGLARLAAQQIERMFALGFHQLGARKEHTFDGSRVHLATGAHTRDAVSRGLFGEMLGAIKEAFSPFAQVQSIGHGELELAPGQGAVNARNRHQMLKFFPILGRVQRMDLEERFLNVALHVDSCERKTHRTATTTTTTTTATG